MVPLSPNAKTMGLLKSKSSTGTTATAIISMEAAGVGSVTQAVGERGANSVTPVKEILFKAMVEYVVRPTEDVPRDSPGGRTVE